MPARPVGAAKRLGALEARKLLSRILREGSTAFSRHAQEEMLADDLTEADVVNVLRCGAVSEGEFERGSWRHRVGTGRMCAVVTFVGLQEIVVVTAWRVRERGR